MILSLAEHARITHTLVKVCHADHPLISYYTRRDQPTPCPLCDALRRLRPAPREEDPACRDSS